MALPTNRTAASTIPEHTADHNTLHALHNSYEGTTPASFEAAGVVATHAAAADPHAGYLKESVISGLATPAVVLGTAAAAGSTTTPIRSDATIAAFDATVPSTQAFADAAATGSVAFAARRDHKHAMPANPVTAHEAAADPHAGYVLESVANVGAWATWVPTYTNFTVGNAVVTARYAKIGRTVLYYIRVVLGSTSVMGTAPTFSLPAQQVAGYGASQTEIGWGTILDAGATNYRAIARVATATTAGVFAIGTSGTWAAHGVVSSTVPMTWVATDNFEIMGQYEAAA